MNIIYEDSQILVCYKEAGLPAQSGRIGEKDLVSILKNRLWEQGGGKKEPYLGIIHRLDQPVEGLLVFAKTPRAAASLSAQVADGRMKKSYHAVVWKERTAGSIPETSRQKKREEEGKGADVGILENYLLKESRTNSSRIVAEGTRGAKLARLEYCILEQQPAEDGQLVLLQVHLFTGRHHQIRVQLAGAGMPLAGDRKYGKDLVPDSVMKYPLALCASSLELVHPAFGKRMEFHCEPQGICFQNFPSMFSRKTIL